MCVSYEKNQHRLRRARARSPPARGDRARKETRRSARIRVYPSSRSPSSLSTLSTTDVAPRGRASVFFGMLFMGCRYPYLLRASRRDHARSRRDALLILGPARGRDARSRDGFKQPLDIRRAPREPVPPEVVPRVLDELDERHQQTPGVRPVHDQALQ